MFRAMGFTTQHVSGNGVYYTAWAGGGAARAPPLRRRRPGTAFGLATCPRAWPGGGLSATHETGCGHCLKTVLLLDSIGPSGPIEQSEETSFLSELVTKITKQMRQCHV